MYRTDYDLYGNRPGAEAFSAQRYPELAALIAQSVHPLRPARVLEVGCGDGSLLDAIRQQWPDIETVGLELSPRAADVARARGHRVIVGKVDSVVDDAHERRFDLVFSSQVIEHTADPVAFLRSQSTCLTPSGAVVTMCPNGAVPHVELVHPDHVFSFTPHHLGAVAGRAGLCPRPITEFVVDEIAEYNQVMVATPCEDSQTGTTPGSSQDEVERLEQMRNAYLRSWASLEAELNERIGQSASVVCFGTGGWSANLAGYAPAVWERVRACTVDNAAASTYLDKPVIDYSVLHEADADTLLLGVNPARQKLLSDRLRRDGFRTIQWNDLIAR